jgi:hypothetical protein
MARGWDMDLAGSRQANLVNWLAASMVEIDKEATGVGVQRLPKRFSKA